MNGMRRSAMPTGARTRTTHRSPARYGVRIGRREGRGGLRSGNRLLPCICPRKPCPVDRVLDPRQHPVPEFLAAYRLASANWIPQQETQDVEHEARDPGPPMFTHPLEPVGRPFFTSLDQSCAASSSQRGFPHGTLRIDLNRRSASKAN